MGDGGGTSRPTGREQHGALGRRVKAVELLAANGSGQQTHDYARRCANRHVSDDLPRQVNNLPLSFGSGVHIDDWRFPTRNFGDRVIMGDGIIPLNAIVQVIEDTGYTGCYEVELFSEELAKVDHDTLLERIKDAYNSIPNGETPWVSR